MSFPDTVPASLTEALGTPLQGVDGRRRSLSSLLGERATAVVFVGNGCPTVRAYEERLMRIHARDGDHVRVIAVNSNNPYLSPPDTMQEMRSRARARQLTYPYLKDPDGGVARGFGAVCTPHAFLLDERGHIVYSGRIDDSRMGDTITSNDLADAIDAMLAGRPVAVDRTTPFGCSIVW
ncbi:MAG: thioredoxin family protein [Pseudonocardia sp.]|nr:thioredoxin family protein [Pseudonocardia sp.]